MFSKLFRSTPHPPSDDSAPKAVYLVMRSEYEVPVGHRVLKFEEAGLLAWFQKYWQDEQALEEMCAPSNILSAMEEWGGSAPGSLAKLKDFAATIHSEQGITFDEHAIQCFHDDDEVDTPWYFFDDVFSSRCPERVAYLLREDWQLPEASSDQGLKLETEDVKQVTEGPGEGCVYGVFLSAYDGMTISGITGNFRFDGVRIPGFAKYLAHGKSPMIDHWSGSKKAMWPEELLLVRSLLLKSDQESFDGFLKTVSHQDLNLRCKEARELNDFRFNLRNPDAKMPGKLPVDRSAIEDPGHFLEGDAAACEKDWLVFEQHLQRSAEKSKSSGWTFSMREPLVQASPHLCQIRFIEDSHYEPRGYAGKRANTWAYIFFDDLWLAANRELGESILRYGAGAEVLKVGEELEE